jgi:phosphonatase-like hydrolase
MGALPRLAVFDLAGTTVVDSGQVPAAFSSALAEAGIDVSAEQIANLRGSSKREAILRMTPEGSNRAERAAATFETFKLHLVRLNDSSGVREIAGARDVFAWLRSNGVRVALNTGFDGEITNLLLERLGWREGVVDAVVCGDDVPEGRPAPYLIFRAMEATGTHRVHDVANVGDTVSDLSAGDNASVRFNIGVLSGAHDRARLEKAPHTHLLTDVTELRRLWSNRE